MSWRRSVARLVLLALAATAAGCAPSPPVPEPTASPLAAEIDVAIRRGVGYLTKQQGDDGAWRSDVYGAFKRGDALTPLALRSLLAVPDIARPAGAIRRGAAYLAATVPARNAETGASQPAAPQFAVYTASQAIEVLSHRDVPGHRAARDAWVRELVGRQLTEDLGWADDEVPYGGWGYSMTVPKKPPPGAFEPPLLESNTSATVFALQGLHAADALNEGICRRAMIFLERMQNDVGPGSAFDDGGFFFVADDPVRNKAGVAGTDGTGRVRFRSYGSTTADGLRGLLLCGLTLDDPRVRSALSWLKGHFSSSEHPGDFDPRLAVDRDGLYFYWAASAAQSFRLAGVGPELGPSVPWAEDLTRELIRRQGTDGSWSNPVVTMREDEPIIATSMALLALSAARDSIF